DRRDALNHRGSRKRPGQEHSVQAGRARSHARRGDWRQERPHLSVATWLHRLFSRQTRDLMAIALVAVGAPSQATLAQTTAPGRRIIHESWTFKQGAPVCASSCSDRRSANDCNAEFLRSMTHDGRGGGGVSFGPLGLYRFKDSVWSKSGRPTRPATLSVVIAFTDALNRVWFGSTQNRLAMLDCDQVRTFGPAERVQVGTIGA